MATVYFSREGDSVAEICYDLDHKTRVIWHSKNQVIVRVSSYVVIRRTAVSVSSQLVEKERDVLDELERKSLYEKLPALARKFLQDYQMYQPLELLYLFKSTEIDAKYSDVKHAKIAERIKSATNGLSLYQVGGVPIGFGMEYGRFHEVTSDEMIQIIRKKNKTFLNDYEIVSDINKIKSSFKDSPITQNKIAIFDSFLEFYNINKSRIFSRSQLVEAWVMTLHDNPFEILAKHRRTGFLSIFNPSKTASMDFFEKFLKGEGVSAVLERFLKGEIKIIAAKLKL